MSISSLSPITIWAWLKVFLFHALTICASLVTADPIWTFLAWIYLNTPRCLEATWAWVLCCLYALFSCFCALNSSCVSYSYLPLQMSFRWMTLSLWPLLFQQSADSKSQPTSRGPPTEKPLAAASLKLLAVYQEDLQRWFLKAKAQFGIHRITVDETTGMSCQPFHSGSSWGIHLWW